MPIFLSGTWEDQRVAWGTHRAPTPHGGAAGLGLRQHMVWGPHGPPLTLLPPLPSSLPTKHSHIRKNRVLAVLALGFSISFLSPSLLLRFGAFALRYVTPPLIQIEFCLVDYMLSILLL